MRSRKALSLDYAIKGEHEESWAQEKMLPLPLSLSLSILFSFLGKGFDGRVFGRGFPAKVVARDIFVADEYYEAVNLILSEAPFQSSGLWLLLHGQVSHGHSTA